MVTFKDLPIAPALSASLESAGFTEPTEIQRKAIPLLLSQPKVDFHGQAQTGTGKTLAFGIPLLQRVNASEKNVQALVVAPTRELALQICDSIKPIAKSLGITILPIYGGVSMEDQIRGLKRGAQIVVGTPGRLNDHLRRGILRLDTCKTLVLDEADIMLDMGFKEEVDEILTFTPKDREIWLFSATVKSGISAIMAAHMHDVQSVRVSKSAVASAQTKHYYCVVPMSSRLSALCRFIECSPEFYGFIFCQTKLLTAEIADQLTRRGYMVGALHGDMSQAQRNMVINKFKNKQLSIVVATDVAARGIDIANLTHVVNYSLPEDHESYVHRSGRTGRAGRDGIAITFVNRQEVRLLQNIQRKFTVKIDPLDVPTREHVVEGRLTHVRTLLQRLQERAMEQQHPAVQKMLDDMDDATIRRIFARHIYEEYIDSIMKESEIAVMPAVKITEDNGLMELQLAVGSDDNLEKEDISDYLTQSGVVVADDIAKIRIIKRRTFIEVPSEKGMQLIEALRFSSLAGRKTRIQLVEPSEQRGERSGGGYRGGDRGDRGDRGGDRGDRRPMRQRRPQR
jgi:ATP-dependent RNA helicase DeaD